MRGLVTAFRISWEDIKLHLQFIAIFAAVACPVLFVWVAANAHRQFASYRWPSVTGDVLGTETKNYIDSQNNVLYCGRVSYRYVVQGKGYTSDLTDLGPGTKRSTVAESLADVSGFQRGAKVEVFYDPSDPGIGVLEKGISAVEQLILLVLATGSVIGSFVAFFTLRSWLRTRRQARAKEIDEQQSPEFQAARQIARALSVVDLPVGETIEFFRPGMSNVIAGFVLGAS